MKSSRWFGGSFALLSACALAVPACDGTGGELDINAPTFGLGGASGSSTTGGRGGASGTTLTAGRGGVSGSNGGTAGTDGGSGSGGTAGTDGGSGSGGTAGTDGGSGSGGTAGIAGAGGTIGGAGNGGTGGLIGTAGTAGSSGSGGSPPVKECPQTDNVQRALCCFTKYPVSPADLNEAVVAELTACTITLGSTCASACPANNIATQACLTCIQASQSQCSFSSSIDQIDSLLKFLNCGL